MEVAELERNESSKCPTIHSQLLPETIMLNEHERREPYPKLLDWLRYFCAFMLYMYGVSKLAHFQFNMSSELAQRPISSLNGYQLTWFYFGYSRVYALMLGLTQVTGATLLLFRKTTLF